MRRLVVVLVAVVIVLFGAISSTHDAADPDLRTYRADVAFDVRLRSFPSLRGMLHANAYFSSGRPIGHLSRLLSA